MKRLYYIIASITFVILLVDVFYYLQNHKTQVGFQRELLSSQVKVCSSKIEKTADNFENDINFILFSDEINSLFEEEIEYFSAIQKLQIFYYKYDDLITNIYVTDTTSKVFSVYKDNKNKFINDLYTSQKKNDLSEKEGFVERDGRYFYRVPVFNENVLTANIAVDIDIQNYIKHEFENYKLGDNLWQWILFSNEIVYDNNKNVTGYSLLDEIIENSNKKFNGFLQHKAKLDKGSRLNVITCYQTLEFIGNAYTIAFSLKTKVLFSAMNKKTLIVVILSLILLIVCIYLIYSSNSKTKEIIVEVEKEVDVTENVITQVVEALPIGIILSDKNQIIRNLNISAKKLLLVDDKTVLKGEKISSIKLLEDNFLKKKSTNSVFDENQFISYEKNGLQTVIAFREVPVKFKKEDYIINILIDITSIEKSRKQADSANFAKSEFLAKMSHEIRTPMNGIIGMIDVLTKAELQNDQKEKLEIIKKSANLLLTLINDILDFSKIESGKMNLEEIPFKLSEEIKFSIDVFRSLAERKHIMITSEIDSNIPDDIVGDPYRLRQVISNLVGNAVKFTNEGEIKISVKLEEDYNDNLTLLFSIEDTGIGIPQKEIENIFASYVQADGSITRKYGGTGLGTTISKQLVNLMNGEIWVESPSSISTNKKYPGSNFSFTIEAYADRRIKKELSFDNTCKPGDVKLLVINERKVGNSFFRPLGKAGFQIINSDFSESLIEELDANKDNEDSKYHFIFIMDMVDRSGFEIAQRIFDSKISSSYVICMLSRNDKHGNYIQSKRLGIDQYLIEPFEINDIFRLIKKYISCLDLEINETDEIRKDIKILVADDNIINQKVAEMIFGNLGFKIDLANNGIEAVKLVNEKNYDIVFTDLMMPELDGWGVVEKLRGSGFDKPIIAMTATASNEIKRKAFKAGMNDYLIKPVEIKTIKNLLLKFFTN